MTTLTVACPTCGARSRARHGHCVVCGNGLEEHRRELEATEIRYCLGCGLGWKPLDQHGFCTYCTEGR